MNTAYTRFESPYCEIILVGNGSDLTGLHLNTGEGTREFKISQDWVRDDSCFRDVIEQIHEYFRGVRNEFDLALTLNGTEFQRRVWRELSGIPFGELRTYREVAVSIGNPKALRAVGAAIGKNPIPLIVPCHRVIGSNGRLTGFAHGLKMKKDLLEFEALTKQGDRT